MKKQLIIHLADGGEVTPDWDMLTKGMDIPIGAPATHPAYMTLCAGVANGFFSDDINAKYLHFIPASQIKSVEIIFEGEAEKEIPKLFLSSSAHD